MDEIMAKQITEVAVSLIQGYFSLLKTSGKTEQEIDQLYNETKLEFEKRTPDKLTPPPV